MGQAIASFEFNQQILLGLTLILATSVLFLEHLAIWRKCEGEYDLLTSPWISRTLFALTILLAANQPSQFIYFEF
ncbi:MAG TPA: hypothetical protein V6C88_15995, partial [Chroococcidiopsis sp.]